MEETWGMFRKMQSGDTQSEAEAQGRHGGEDKAEKRGVRLMVDCFQCQIEFRNSSVGEGRMLKIFEEGS